MSQQSVHSYWTVRLKGELGKDEPLLVGVQDDRILAGPKFYRAE
jgi:hypothetical protein